MKAADLKLSQFYKTAFGTEDSQFEKNDYDSYLGVRHLAQRTD